MIRAAFAVLLLAGSAQAAGPLAVRLKVSGTAHGPNILMGDVVDGLPEEAAALSVKPSGRPGTRTSVDAGLVALKLRRAPGGPYALSGPARSDVQVSAQDLPGATLRSFAQQQIEARLSGTAGVEIKPLGAVNDIRLYGAPVRLNLGPIEDDQLRGNVVLRVQIMQEGAGGAEREAASVPVSFLVKRRELRLVAVRAIRKGEALGGDNLELREMDATMDDRGFGALGDVEGKQARAFIAAGKALTRPLVDFPPLIRRGDSVRVIVRSGAVQIEATGTAQRDAREGESLPVLMENSKKTMQARCVEAGVAVHEAR